MNIFEALQHLNGEGVILVSLPPEQFRLVLRGGVVREIYPAGAEVPLEREQAMDVIARLQRHLEEVEVKRVGYAQYSLGPLRYRIYVPVENLGGFAAQH